MINFSPARILAQYLIDQNIVTDPRDAMIRDPTQRRWPAYTNSLPDPIDEAVHIKNMAGTFDGRLMRGGDHNEHPGVSIMIRATNDGDDGWDKGCEIGSALDALNNVTVVYKSRTFTIQNAKRTTPLTSLGEERGKRRQLFSINLRLTVWEVL